MPANKVKGDVFDVHIGLDVDQACIHNGMNKKPGKQSLGLLYATP